MKLQIGDCLGYGVEGVSSYFRFPFEQLVQTKTWSDLYHVEVYVGGGLSLSADYRGVDLFPTNLVRDRLKCVLRPHAPFDIYKALRWFNLAARGKQYDALGLLRFYRITVDRPDAFICSELATLFYRVGGLHLFNDVPAANVSPGMFRTEDAFYSAWERGSKDFVAA